MYYKHYTPLSARERALVFSLYRVDKFNSMYLLITMYFFEKIHRGDAMIERITIPEGITASTLFARLSAHEALEGELTLSDGVWEGLATPGLPMKALF